MNKMDAIRLAQLFCADKKNIDILENIDISYCIPDESPETLQKKVYGGYNCLHFAAIRSNLKFINAFLDKGADLLKQGTRHGETPVHVAITHNNYPSSTFVWKLMGELKENQIVNTLLSAEVKRNNPFNTKSKKGMTHLHIACAVNHTEAVTFFVNVGKSLDQAINSDEYYLPGYTALHFAVKYSSIESAEILLNNGADIHFKDVKGISPLGLLIQRLLNIKDFISMGKKTLYCTYQSEMERLQTMAQLFLKTREPDHINFVDDTGLSTFYLACLLSDSSNTSKLLKKIGNINVSISNDSLFCPGWTPLHFAACSSIEMVKLLLQNGASINLYNAKGKTALDFCTMRYNPENIYSILSTKNNIKNILLSDRATKMLDLVSAMNDGNALNIFLERLANSNISVPANSPIWPGYNALHLAIIMNEKIKIEQELYCEKPNYLAQMYISTADDSQKYWERIAVCLSNNCSLNAKNADGLSPIHLAFQLRKERVVDLLLNNCKDNITDSNNLSILHIACATGRKDIVERLISGGANVNIQTRSSFEWYGKPLQSQKFEEKPYYVPARLNSTPLHVAVIFEYYHIVYYLLKNGADAYAKDALGLTPIHLSMSQSDSNPLANATIARHFLRRISNLQESVSKDGLSHLHVAAYADDKAAVVTLIRRGANINSVFNTKVPDFNCDEHPPCELSFLARYAGMTPLFVAVRRYCGGAIRALIQNGADIFTRNLNGDTPLNSLVDRFDFDFSKHFSTRLKQDERFNEAIDPCGLTLLHVACATLDLNWAKKILEKGANVNAQIKGYEDGDEEWTGDTPLHLLINEASKRDRPVENLEDFVRLLLKYGANVTIQSGYSSPLHVAHNVACCEGQVNRAQATTMLSIADLMLRSQESYAINPVDYHGYSHFHYACSRNEVRIVKKFLDGRIDINLSIDPFSNVNPGSTPLHIAFKHKSEEVARLLIERGADVKAQDKYGNTPMHDALAHGIGDLEILQIMLSKGADINAKNFGDNDRPIDRLLNSSNITYKKLKFFLSNGATIDITHTWLQRTTIGMIMKNSEPQDRQAIFTKLMNMFNLSDAVKGGFNAIENIVTVDQNGQLTLDYYLEKIQMFMDMGCKIDQQNSRGQTALHQAANRYNLQAIEALLLLGAKMNVTDESNEPPFTIDVYEFCDTGSEHEVSSIKVLSTHTWKMRLAGLNVHAANEEAMEAAFEQFPMDPNLQSRCDKELNKLQQENVGELTMKDFLYGSRAVTGYPTMSFAQRQTIKDFFKCTDILRGRFPEFAGLLTMQYKKALQREKLYETAKEALATTLQIQLPDLCSENILVYFENEELIHIIEAVDSIF